MKKVNEILIEFHLPSTVPAGNLANASSVGANIVNGPGPDNVSTKPAALTAAIKETQRMFIK